MTRQGILLWLLLAFLSHPLSAGVPVDFPGPVNTQNREEVSLFFNSAYYASEDAQPDWTGSLETGLSGATSGAFKEAVLRRINWFRAMAGVPAQVRFNPDYSRMAQQAALMMSANFEVNHSPPPTWKFHTAEGALAASKSLLELGEFGPAAIDAYMRDDGVSNFEAGHRRLLLVPSATVMGTGDLPSCGAWLAANATWVINGGGAAAPDSARDGFVAWPPPGYVPWQVVYKRWSFSLAGAGFDSASVEMTRADGSRVDLKPEPVAYGKGDNTIVWSPSIPLPSGGEQVVFPVTADLPFQVVIRDVEVSGVRSNYSYTVTITDPAPPPSAGAPAFRWAVTNEVRSAAALGGSGTLYWFMASRLHALDPRTAKPLWSTPVFADDAWVTLDPDGTAYVGKATIPGGLEAYSGASGNRIWSFSAAGRLGGSAALSTNGMLYFGTGYYYSSNRLETEGKLFAVERTSGRKRWEFEAGADIEASPVVGAGGAVFCATSVNWNFGVGEVRGRVYALDALSGQKLWSFEADRAVRGGLALDGDGKLYFGTEGGRFYCLDSRTGAKLWDFVTRGGLRHASPIIGRDQTVYFGTLSGRMYALNGQSGTKQWGFDAVRSIDSAPAISADGTLYFGAMDGYVYAIEASTGRKLWSLDTGGQVTTSSPLIAPDGGVFIGSEARYQLDQSGQIIRTKGVALSFAQTNGGLSGSDWPMVAQNPRHTSSGKTANHTRQPQLWIASASDGSPELHWEDIPALAWSLEGSTNLVEWLSLSIITNGSGPNASYPLKPRGESGARFFRLRLND